MEGDCPQRTPQPGKVMFPTHQMEVRDAKHGQATSESEPPAAKGDRPSPDEPAPGLIAQHRRLSFLELLTGLWEAKDELKRSQSGHNPKQKHPQSASPDQEEKP